MSNYLGRYYNLTGGWTEQRALWWPMLAEILTTGADVQTAADNFVSQANATSADLLRKHVSCSMRSCARSPE